MERWLREIRLFGSRHIGFWWAPVGQWEESPHGYQMRRLLPNGDYEYRTMTYQEAWDAQSGQAW